MVSNTCVRITWLVFDQEREAYRVHRGLVAPEDLPAPGGHTPRLDPLCLRCGSPVGTHGGGARAPYTVLTRARLSTCKDVRAHAIHGGCIPRAGEQPVRGIPARGRNATQVRAIV